MLAQDARRRRPESTECIEGIEIPNLEPHLLGNERVQLSNRVPPRRQQIDHVVDEIGTWHERTGATRFYLQVLDLADLDHLELIAAEVAPQLR